MARAAATLSGYGSMVTFGDAPPAPAQEAADAARRARARGVAIGVALALVLRLGPLQTLRPRAVAFLLSPLVA